MMIEQERIPLRQRRDLGEIIQAALQLYMQNPVPLILIAAIVIPLRIADAAFQNAIDDPEIAFLVFLGIAVLEIIATVVASGAIITALQSAEAGQAVDFGSAVDAAFAKLGTLVGGTFRAITIVLLLTITILGIPWAIRQFVRWLFIAQAVMIDDVDTVVGATDRSADRVIGSWWRTFGIAIVIGLLTAIPSAIAGGIFFLAPLFVSAIADAIITAVMVPFGVIAMTLLYFDLSVRKEAVATATPE